MPYEERLQPYLEKYTMERLKPVPVQPVRDNWADRIDGNQPIRSRYLGHMTRNQPIRAWYMFNRCTFTLDLNSDLTPPEYKDWYLGEGSPVEPLKTDLDVEITDALAETRQGKDEAKTDTQRGRMSEDETVFYTYMSG